jgi:hypothetical protein
MGVSSGVPTESSIWAQQLHQATSGFKLETVKVNCADPAWPENQSGITTARGMDVFQGDSRSWSYPFVGLVSRTFIAAMRS